MIASDTIVTSKKRCDVRYIESWMTGDKTMFVEQLLPTARERLVRIADDRPLIQVT